MIAGAGFVFTGVFFFIMAGRLRYIAGKTEMNQERHHHHHHEAPDYNRAFAVGVALNVIFVVIEVAYGVMADSLALIELVEQLEEELSERTVGFRIDDEDLEDLKTVRDAVDYVFENAND